MAPVWKRRGKWDYDEIEFREQVHVCDRNRE
jgi:hypothetical protein